METMGTLRRTNYCGEVSLANAGQEMTVCGSIARARDKGGIIFADLREPPASCSWFLTRIRQKTFSPKPKA